MWIPFPHGRIFLYNADYSVYIYAILADNFINLYANLGLLLSLEKITAI